ncbi:MAG: hypothetical protein ACJAZK_002247 [Psychroserpens sp.]|jgi:hypothetical protein
MLISFFHNTTFTQKHRKTKKHPDFLIQKKGKLLIGKNSTTLSFSQLSIPIVIENENNTTSFNC